VEVIKTISELILFKIVPLNRLNTKMIKTFNCFHKRFITSVIWILFWICRFRSLWWSTVKWYPRAGCLLMVF